MKKIFVDTNVIIDLIADRQPFSKYAIELFSKAENNEFQLFVSSHSIATTHYLLKKFVDEKALRDIISNLIDFVSVISVDISILNKALKSKHKDFEDAIQIMCAHNVSDINCIVTRNIKDFQDCGLAVYAPDELSKIS